LYFEPVVAAAKSNETAVGVIKMEVSSEVRRARFTIERGCI
jgi:hypothetical protein